MPFPGPGMSMAAVCFLEEQIFLLEHCVKYSAAESIYCSLNLLVLVATRIRIYPRASAIGQATAVALMFNMLVPTLECLVFLRLLKQPQFLNGTNPAENRM